MARLDGGDGKGRRIGSGVRKAGIVIPRVRGAVGRGSGGASRAMTDGKCSFASARNAASESEVDVELKTSLRCPAAACLAPDRNTV